MAPVLRVAFIALLVVLPALAQQKYIGKYDVYAGYAYLNSPSINLAEHGFHFQIGMRPRTWLDLGFDYSRATGPTTLTPDMLIPELQAALGAQLKQLAAAGLIPAGYKLTVPIDSTSQTFAAGPQLAFHKWRSVSLFVRPNLGVMLEKAIAAPTDPIAKKIVAGLAPGGTKDDWVPFFGFGGGIDIHVSRNMKIRFQADQVWDHLFDDMLPWRGTVRISVGPSFQFGKNILE